LEPFKAISGSFGSLQAVLSLFGPLRATLGSLEAYWAISEHFRPFQSVSEPVLTVLVRFGVFMAVWGHFK
jgi:hypothetical protein